MVLAEGWRERRKDARERWSAKAVVWQGSVGEVALHTNNLLVLRGTEAVHKPLPGASLTRSELLCVLESWLDNILMKRREDFGVNC